MKDKKNRVWIILLAAVCILGAAGFLLLKGLDTGTVAVITVDGGEYARIDLSRVTESYQLQIDSAWGHNTVLVEPGAISVTEADCPDKICVQQGRLTGGGVPIVCMPHRLVIQIEGGETDA